MNIAPKIILLAAISIVAASANAADTIYKWVDEDGNVHYQDRPTANENVERLQLTYNRTDSSAVAQREQLRRDSVAARSAARAEANAEKRTAAEERAAAEERFAACQRNRAQLKVILEARRLYRQDENGERTYLDDEGRDKAREEAENRVRDTCG